MNLTQYFGEAFAVLLANRTRSILTVTGLVIGVMAVIAIQVLGAGTAGAVGGVLGAISERAFFVFPSQQADFARASIKVSDLQRAPSEIPNIVGAMPGGGQRVVASYGDVHRRITFGASADERFATSTPVRFGRKISIDDITDERHVCVISDQGYRRLRMTGDPTGGSVRVGDRRFTIVGVLGTDKSGILPLNFNADVVIPYPTYERYFVHGNVAFSRFLMNDASKIGETEAETVAWLRQLKGGRYDYQTFDRKAFSKSVDSVFSVITFIVALIGAVSLLVAGIGILNIMLVSVAERTREIGLRKAIGATRFQVLLQFFIEALALSGFGCLVGLLLGVAIGATVNDLFIVKFSGVVAPIPWVRSILIATVFTTVVTLAFGTYPAWRAATLDPIEALRYE
ncbi:MAG TPA: ABC transporter permease [Candidatus Elarobacter sp.]|jgi:putative ABC transport system permease protein|nr:ABC transporter permease [Candidatus Elarobacter sp.]